MLFSVASLAWVMIEAHVGRDVRLSLAHVATTNVAALSMSVWATWSPVAVAYPFREVCFALVGLTGELRMMELEPLGAT